ARSLWRGKERRWRWSAGEGISSRRLLTKIGDSAFAIPADVSRTSEIEHLFDQTVRRFGGLNFLLNNTGVLHIGNVEQISEEQWDHTFNVNVRAVLLLSRAALPHMRKVGGGSIMNIASTLG